MERTPGCSIFVVALLLNLSWSDAQAADENGYTAAYECRTGSPNCNVPVETLSTRQCDQIATTATQWSAVNWSADANNDGTVVICLQDGDHTSKGTLVIPAGADGAANDYRVLRYTRANDSFDAPWNQVSQAKLSKLEVHANYWLIDRLTFPGFGGNNPPLRVEAVASAGDLHDVILNRLLVEGLPEQSIYYGFSQRCDVGSYHHLTVQNSVFRNLGPSGPPIESVAVDLQCGDFLRSVNNEIYDWAGHAIQIGQDFVPELAGAVVENNDLYVTSNLYVDGGTKAKTESPLSMKARGAPGQPSRIIHNRIWGGRVTNTNFCCNGTDGDAIGHYAKNSGVLFQDNILFDSQIGVNNAAAANSFVGNIFWSIKPYSSERASLGLNLWDSPHFDPEGIVFYSPSAYEVYHNSFIDVPQFLTGSLAQSDTDIRCNAVISSGSPYAISPVDNAIADNNVFYGSTAFAINGADQNLEKTIQDRAASTFYSVGQILRTAPPSACTASSNSACFLYKVTSAGTSASGSPTYCTELGCTTTDGGATVQAVRGPYTFARKLLTGAETIAIPYAMVHASADEAQTSCPSTVGSRTGIGISDGDTQGSGVLALDVRQVTRAGTAGALEASGDNPPPPPGQAPFPGPDPAAIPGTVEAENFDNGGEGIAYHDTEETNWGNAPGYRETGVDIESDQNAANDHFVAVFFAGEWLEYTVDVASAGTYTLEINVASQGSGGSFHVEFDGVNKTPGGIVIPDTGGWYTWQTLTSTLTLDAGVQVVRIQGDANGPSGAVGNIDFLRLSAASSPRPFPGPGPTNVPGTIEAENFDNGGEGVAYHDIDETNWGNAPGYRETGVDIEGDPNASNAHFVAVFFAGEWLEYTVDVPSAGTYTLEVAVASNGDGGNFHVAFNGVNKTPGGIAIPNTGGWYTWQAVTRTVTLDAGTQILRVQGDANGATGAVGNVDYVRLTSGSAPGPVGHVIREYILDVPDEVSYPNFDGGNSGNDQLTVLEGPVDFAERYANRIRGYLHPPQSGTYTFWVAGDDDSQLLLSSDESPANAVVIASLVGWTLPREWTKFPSQQSVGISLQADQRYYFEVRHREYAGNDNIAVRWQLPSGALEGPIPGSRLSPIP